jgi:hypothetical protein
MPVVTVCLCVVAEVQAIKDVLTDTSRIELASVSFLPIYMHIDSNICKHGKELTCDRVSLHSVLDSVGQCQSQRNRYLT